MGEKSYKNQSKFKEEMREAPSPPPLPEEVGPGLDVIYLLFLVISRDILHYYRNILRKKNIEITSNSLMIKINFKIWRY